MIQLPGRFVNGRFLEIPKKFVCRRERQHRRPSAAKLGEASGKEAGKGKFIFPNFGAFFSGNTGHFELVVLV